MAVRTKVISVHKLRRNARALERRVQTLLDAHAAHGLGLPEWTQGVRVEKAGLFQWAVVVTEDRGH